MVIFDGASDRLLFSFWDWANVGINNNPTGGGIVLEKHLQFGMYLGISLLEWRTFRSFRWD